jgi:hypothetical protein
VRADRLGNLTPDREARVQRGHRILEDHADAIAAQDPHLLVRQTDEVASLEPDRAAHVGGSREQAHQGERERRLAASGFADQAEDLALGDLERHVGDRRHVRGPAPEVHVAAIDLQERGHRVTPRGSSRSRRPSPIRLNASTVIAIASPGKISTQEPASARRAVGEHHAERRRGRLCAESQERQRCLDREREPHQDARLDDGGPDRVRQDVADDDPSRRRPARARLR